MKIDKQNGDVCFNEEFHKYWNIKDPNKSYISATTLISEYHEKFDTAYWSTYKAIEQLLGGKDTFKSNPMRKVFLDTKKIEPKQIKALGLDLLEVETLAKEIAKGYEDNCKDACEYGTAHHLGKEQMFYTKSKHKLKSYNSRFANCETEFECKKNYFELDIVSGIYPEYLIYWESKDGLLRISGQMDLLVKDGNDIYIFDYKSNRKGIETKSFFDTKTRKNKMMLYPVNDMQDCSLSHYTLQLSLYAWMLQQLKPEFNVKLLMLKHTSRDNVETEYELEYCPKRIERMLKDYKRKIYIKQQKEELC